MKKSRISEYIFENKMRDIYFYYSLLFLLISTKILFLLNGSLLPDEAYYWLWSKNIDISFYDHPPLSSWIQGIFSLANIGKYFEIRVVPTVCFLTIFFFNMHWVKQFSNYSNDILQPLKGSVIFCSVPLYGIFLTISFPDAIMVLCIYLSGYYFFKFLHSCSQNESKFIFWYLAIIFFSLSCLGKYNAILYGLGIFLFVISNNTLRRILLPVHLGTAFSIFLIFQLPIIVWNINHDFASVNFHLNTRLKFNFSFLSFTSDLLIFAIGVILSVSPLIFLKVIQYRSKKSEKMYEFLYLRSGYWVLTTTLAICVFLNIFTNVLYYWAIIGFVMFIPLLPLIIEKKSHILYQAIFGFCFLSLLYVNSTIYPLALFFGPVDRETAILYGWDKVTNKVEENKRKHGVYNVIFMDYRLASLYSFHAYDLEADAIMADRETQFDIWRFEKNIKPKQSLIIVDQAFPIHQKIGRVFNEIIFLEEFPVVKGKHTLNVYKIYLGKV